MQIVNFVIILGIALGVNARSVELAGRQFSQDHHDGQCKKTGGGPCGVFGQCVSIIDGSSACVSSSAHYVTC